VNRIPEEVPENRKTLMNRNTTVVAILFTIILVVTQIASDVNAAGTSPFTRQRTVDKKSRKPNSRKQNSRSTSGSRRNRSNAHASRHNRLSSRQKAGRQSRKRRLAPAPLGIAHEGITFKKLGVQSTTPNQRGISTPRDSASGLPTGKKRNSQSWDLFAKPGVASGKSRLFSHADEHRNMRRKYGSNPNRSNFDQGAPKLPQKQIAFPELDGSSKNPDYLKLNRAPSSMERSPGRNSSSPSPHQRTRWWR
jgi:hypothetical protein